MYYIQSAQTHMLTSLPDEFFSNYDFWNFFNTYFQIIKIFRTSYKECFVVIETSVFQMRIFLAVNYLVNN